MSFPIDLYVLKPFGASTRFENAEQVDGAVGCPHRSPRWLAASGVCGRMHGT